MPTQNAAREVCEVQLTEGSVQLPVTVENPLPTSAYPALASALEPLRSLLPGLRMTGTGAAFFTPVDGPGQAGRALQVCAAHGLKAWLCHPVAAWS